MYRHWYILAGQEIQERTAYNSFNYSPVFDEEHRIVGFPEMDGIDGSYSGMYRHWYIL